MSVERTVEDTRCPSCDEPVGARATYCMHCGRDLPDRAEFDDPGGDADGGSLLGRIRRKSSSDADDPVTGTSDSVQWSSERSSTSETGDGSGRSATDDERGDPVKFLGGLVGVGVVGVLVLGLSLPVAGVLLALLAWATSCVSLARRRSAFHAMQYATTGFMVTLIFVSFALAFGSTSALAGLAFTLVPVGLAALFVAGLDRRFERYALV